jgi:murein L,D-transpeptidase YcbB/YkuD
MPRIISGWSSEPAGRLVRPAGFAMALAAALAAASPAHAQNWQEPGERQAEQSQVALQWFAQGDDQAAATLIDLLETSRFDGLEPTSFPIDRLRETRERARLGDWSDIDDANRIFDRAFVAYVRALRAAAPKDWVIVDKGLTPRAESSEKILSRAAAAPSLAAYLGSLGFMHPAYAELRRTLEWARSDDRDRSEALVKLNMDRLRMLPSSGRYVLVNIASQRLQMIERGRVVDEMKVVVGKPNHATPQMAALIRYAALNPYWQVPHDLAAERVAPQVVKEGLNYLDRNGYVVLSDWGANATRVDPSTIDWQAVADGKVQVRLRQEPGPHNSMGQMKFMFPNAQGIYLHDTPNKELLNEDARLFSGGCVRLEDAPRLARWMFGEQLQPEGAGTEHRVDLRDPVPVYIAYLTAMPDGNQLAIYDDIYGRDREALAERPSGGGRLAIF